MSPVVSFHVGWVCWVSHGWCLVHVSLCLPTMLVGSAGRSVASVPAPLVSLLVGWVCRACGSRCLHLSSFVFLQGFPWLVCSFAKVRVQSFASWRVHKIGVPGIVPD